MYRSLHFKQQRFIADTLVEWQNNFLQIISYYRYDNMLKPNDYCSFSETYRWCREWKVSRFSYDQEHYMDF